MRIFQAFLVMVIVALLWMLPVTQAIYDFRTDVREDNFTVTTGAGEFTADVILFRPVYDDDDETISALSSIATDTPAIDNYNPATREVTISGLDENSTRVLTVFYDVDALALHPAISLIMDLLPLFWILILIAFPVVAVIVIFTGQL